MKAILCMLPLLIIACAPPEPVQLSEFEKCIGWLIQTHSHRHGSMPDASAIAKIETYCEDFRQEEK